MSKYKEILSQIDELVRRAAQIKTSAAKIKDTPAYTLDDYDKALLLANLEIALGMTKSLQMQMSYLSRPVKETSRLWKNGSGQYETTQGHLFREGSPIEVLVSHKYCLDGPLHWERTRMGYDGTDYFLAGRPEVQLRGLSVRIREGDET